MTGASDRPTQILMMVGDTIGHGRRTGIHRVAIEAARGLAGQIRFDLVRWDLVEGRLRFLDAEELSALFGPGEDWPEGIGARPEARKVGRPFREQLEDPARTWLLAPEVGWHEKNGIEFMARAVAHCREWGGRSAFVFYDLIPIKNPAYAIGAEPHEAYLAELLHADLIVPISVDSGEALRGLWAERAIAPHPPITPLLLPDGGSGPRRSPSPEAAALRRIALVGTVEPRKRQVQFLQAMAAARLRSPEVAQWRVTVIGSLHADVADAFLALAKADWVTHLDYASDAEVKRTIAEAAFTAFVSDDEGYGLPIAESLALGTPCLCANHGSMLEVAAGGGCYTVDVRSGEALESAIVALCETPEILRRLRDEIATRQFRTWSDYGAGLIALMAGFDPGPSEASVACEAAPPIPADGVLDDETFERLARADVVGFASEGDADRFIAEARERRWPALLPTRLVAAGAEAEASALARERMERRRIARMEQGYAKARSAIPPNFKTRGVFLRILISTYNRCDFVVANVRWLLNNVIRSDQVELVVVDGGSTDGTLPALEQIRDSRLTIISSPTNVGMLAGWREAARWPGAEYTWVIGDDDFIKPAAFADILAGLRTHPGLPFAFTNFAVYHRAAMSPIDVPSNLLRESRPVAQAVAPSGVMKTWEACQQTDNLFTAIYTIIWRTELLSVAYDYPFDGAPFANMTEAIPCTDYILRRYSECDAYWYGGIGIGANAHNSWSVHRPRWHGAVMPMAFSLGRDVGMDPRLLQTWADMHLDLLHEELQIARARGADPRLRPDDRPLAKAVFRDRLPEALMS